MKFKKLAALAVAGALGVGVCAAGCAKKQYEYDYSHFYGLCEVSGEISSDVDRGLTHDFISGMAGAFGVNSFRVWMSMGTVLKVGEGDTLTFNAQAVEQYHDLLDKLSEQGVDRFSLMCSGFIYPWEYQTTTGLSVPDPNEEYEMYVRFLELQGRAFAMVAEEFPAIRYFEPANEPNIESGAFLHKNGYTAGGTMQSNADYMYTESELAHIIGDLCWYINRGVQGVDKDSRVLLPSLCNYATAPDFLDAVYKAIESKTLPVAQEYSDTDPDNYFQILNWHPYSLVTGEIDSDWVALQKEIYAVAEAHNDGGKPVWYTEMGWTDYRNENNMQTIADRYIKLFDTVRGELPFVETVFIFRLSTLAVQQTSEAEDNFGIVFNPLDEQFPGMPKPAAIAIYRYIHGQDADLTPLYKFAAEKENTTKFG